MIPVHSSPITTSIRMQFRGNVLLYKWINVSTNRNTRSIFHITTRSSPRYRNQGHRAYIGWRPWSCICTYIFVYDKTIQQISVLFFNDSIISNMILKGGDCFVLLANTESALHVLRYVANDIHCCGTSRVCMMKIM